MKKNNLKPLIVLSSICIAVALVLALINAVTAPMIKEAQDKAAKAALLEVLPTATDFTELTLDDSYPEAITKGYSAQSGYVFQAKVTGKSSGLIIMVGLDSDGKIVATKVIASEETKDYAAKVFPLVEGSDGKYKDMTEESFEPFLVSGATLTSRAYGDAIDAALKAFSVAKASASAEGGQQ